MVQPRRQSTIRKPKRPPKRDNSIIDETAAALEVIFDRVLLELSNEGNYIHLSVEELAEGLSEWGFEQNEVDQLILVEFDTTELQDKLTATQFVAGVASLKTRLRPLPRRLSLSGTVASSLSDPIHMQRANRKLLGLSVWAMKHSFAQLYAEHGFPISEERCLPSPKVDREGNEAVRRPMLNDIKQSVLLEYTHNHMCSRDGQGGCALIDLLEQRDGAECVGAANLMISFQWVNHSGSVFPLEFAAPCTHSFSFWLTR